MYMIGYYWYNDQIVQITYYAKGSSGNVQYVLKGYLKVHQLEGDLYSVFLRGLYRRGECIAGVITCYLDICVLFYFALIQS
jgi:hypothetical protein